MVPNQHTQPKHLSRNNIAFGGRFALDFRLKVRSTVLNDSTGLIMDKYKWRDEELNPRASG